MRQIYKHDNVESVKPVETDFDENSVNAKDFTSESRIKGLELKEMIEIQNHFFI